MGVFGVIATVGFLIFLAILVIYCCCRVRRKRSDGLPEASPYRQTCHPSSPSNLNQANPPNNYNPYFMEGGANQGQSNFLNVTSGPGANLLNPHQSTVLYPTTGVTPAPSNTTPYPNVPQGMPMPQNYVPTNFQPSAPLPIPSGADQPPPYHAVVGQNQNPYQPYKFQ